MVIDDSYVTWNDDDFPTYDWTDFYQDVSEDVPSNAPLPMGGSVQINVFVDAACCIYCYKEDVVFWFIQF